MESNQADIANELDLQPAELQSSEWVGGKDITGVKDARNYTAALNQRIAKTAEHHGMTEEDVMKKFLNQEMILKALLGSVGTGTILGGMSEQ
jgi:hypothetical protein